MIRRLYDQVRRELFPEPPTIRREPLRRAVQPPPRTPERKFEVPPRQPPTRVGPARTSGASRTLVRDLATRDGLRRAFLLTEILGPPVSMRDRRD